MELMAYFFDTNQGKGRAMGCFSEHKSSTIGAILLGCRIRAYCGKAVPSVLIIEEEDFGG